MHHHPTITKMHTQLSPKCTTHHQHDTRAGVRVYTTTTKTNNNIPPTLSTTFIELIWEPTPTLFSFIWLLLFSCWPFFKRASQSMLVEWKDNNKCCHRRSPSSARVPRSTPICPRQTSSGATTPMETVTVTLTRNPWQFLCCSWKCNFYNCIFFRHHSSKLSLYNCEPIIGGVQIYFAIRFTKTAHLLLASFGTKSLAAPKAAAEMVSGFQCLLGKNIDIDIELSHIYAGWQKLCGSTGGTRRKVWTRTKILSPNIRYFVAN